MADRVPILGLLVSAPQPARLAKVVSDPATLGGMPVVAGTRVPANSIVACLQDAWDSDRIHAAFPSLPAGAVRAVEAWALHAYGPDWRTPFPDRFERVRRDLGLDGTKITFTRDFDDPAFSREVLGLED